MTNETQHSPEPWTVEDRVFEEDRFFIGPASDGHFIASVYAEERGTVDEANARRIVAAVNACAGIPTAALEAGAERAEAALAKVLDAAASVLSLPEGVKALGYLDRGIGTMSRDVAWLALRNALRDLGRIP